MTGDQRPSGPKTTLEQRLNVDFALQAAGLGIWEYDPASDQVLWDERCRTLFGLAADNQMSYAQAFEHIHTDDLTRIDQAAKWAMNPLSDGIFDQTYRTVGIDDGKLRWVRFQGRIDFTATGEVQWFGGVAQDVTRQVLDQQALVDTQQLVLRQFEQAPVGIATISGDELRFCSANRFYGELVGRSPDQLVGKSLLEVLPELQGQGFDHLLKQVMATKKPFVAKEVVVDLIRNGQLERIYIDLTYQLQPSANERLPEVLVIAIDVTDQVLNRREIEESEARFKSLIERAPIATCLFVGRELRIDVANEAMIQVWGKGVGVLGLPLAEALPELKDQHFLTTIGNLFDTGDTFSAKAGQADLVIDGQLQTFYFDYDFIPLRNKQGTIYAILETATDVTRQVLDQRALTASEATLRNAIELAELGTWSMTIATNATELSLRQTHMFGLANTQLSYEEGIAVVHPDDRERVEAAFLAAIQPGSGGRYEAEYRIINAQSGKHQIIRARGETIFDEQNWPTRITGMTQDVTLERELLTILEHQVQQRTEELAASNEELRVSNEEVTARNEEYAAVNEELEEANILLIRSNDNLQTFAYIASHDLQEPLRKIQQFGNLLQLRQGESKLDAESATYVERMQTAASRMSTLIRDLLSFSRISTQRSSEELVSLTEVISEILDTLELAIAEVNAQVQVTMLPTLPGDPVQLGQLFQNLLGNALKFRRAGITPQINVSSQLVASDTLPPSVRPTRRADNYHLISVTDNGIGFEEKYLDRIFQVFQRLHGKNEFAGTGVGLAICEKVATNHGGVITASSQPGQGATFSVYLPA